jgi:hypothetical protein
MCQCNHLNCWGCIYMQIKDIDFQQHQALVRDKKGFGDRLTVLPDIFGRDLHRHPRYIRMLHEMTYLMVSTEFPYPMQ